MLDVIFEQAPWESAVEALQPGQTLSAMKLLGLLEEEDEETVLEALDKLAVRQVMLDISDLPELPVSGDTALRLRQEAQLVHSGQLPRGLEENDPLRLYLQELAAIPTGEDEALLLQRYLRGSDTAAEQLVAASLHRVAELAKEMVGKGVLLLDLIQEGGLGLWQGINCYEGGDFSAHRDWWIRQALARAVFLQARSGDLGQKLRQGMEDYRDVDQHLLSQLGRNPTLEEIAEAMHITAEEAAVYADMMSNARLRQRVDAAMEPKEAQPEDEQAVENTAYFQMRQRITELLSSLPEDDAKLLTLRFGLEGGMPLSPEDTGKKLGLTAQEVVSREANALMKLRNEK